MKILHVIGSLRLANGGPPRISYGLSKALAGHGHEVTLLTTDLDEYRAEQLSIRFPNGGSLAVVCPSNGRSLGNEGVELLHGMQMVHLHDIWGLYSTRLARACKRQGIPFVFMPHGALDVWSLKQKWLKKQVFLTLLGRRTLESANAYHLGNQEEVDGIRRAHLTGRYFVLPNGVDPLEWQELPASGTFRSAYPEIGDKLLVVFLARLHHKKGPDLLARAFIALANRFPNTFLVLAGPDEGLKPVVEGLLAEAGLQARSLVPGLLIGEQRAALLRDADIYVLPSHQEGHPMSVVEAAFVGKTLLITPECHCSELKPGLAAEVVADNEDSVTRGLERLLTDGAYRTELAKRAREVAAETYIWPRIAERLLVEYAAIQAGGGCLHSL